VTPSGAPEEEARGVETAAGARPERWEGLEQRWWQYFAEEYRTGRPRSQPANRASVLPNACENYVLMYRRWWKEHVRPEPRLCSVFRQGNVMEKDTRLLLEHELGFELRRSQMAEEWPAYQITGSIDTEILVDGEWVLAEFKSVHPNLYSQLKSVADLANHRFHVYRRYPGQLLLYQWLGNHDRALLIPRNKSTSEVKGLWQYLDEHLEEAEALVKRAERVNAALLEETPNLEQLADPEVCEECEFAARCAPPITFTPPLIARDPRFLGLLDERGQLEEASGRFKEVHTSVRAALNHVVWQDPEHPERPPAKTVLAGPWTIERRESRSHVVSYKIRLAEEPKEEEAEA